MSPLGARRSAALALVLALRPAICQADPACADVDASRGRQLEAEALLEQGKLEQLLQRLTEAKGKVADDSDAVEKTRKLDAKIALLTEKLQALRKLRLERRAAGCGSGKAFIVGDLVGEVKLCPGTTDSPACRPMRKGDVLLPGETIRTGKDGRVALESPPTSLRINPNTRYTMGDDGMGYLPLGVVFYLKHPGLATATMADRLTKPRAPKSTPAGALRGQATPAIRTPDAVSAVRGTKFSLSVGSDGITHLAPEEGIIELSAVRPPPAAGGWWGPLAPSGGRTESEPILLRHSGETMVRDAHGEREIPADGALLPGQTVRAGAEGAAVGLGAGAWAALKPGARLEILDPAGPRARLVEGALFAQAGREAELVLASPGGMLFRLSGGAAEFALSKDGKPDVVVREGTVIVEATP